MSDDLSYELMLSEESYLLLEKDYERLKAELAAKDAEIAEYKAFLAKKMPEWNEKNGLIDRISKDLAASQALCVKLRWAIGYFRMTQDEHEEQEARDRLEAAYHLPTYTTALREVCLRVAKECKEHDYTFEIDSESIVDEVLEGKS